MRYVSILIILVGVFIYFPETAESKPINQCLDISLEKPTGSYNTRTVAIRATNDCKDALYFSYVVCSNDKIFSHDGGTVNLYNTFSARNNIIPRSTTYKWSHAGGFTYFKDAGEYNFKWKASYTAMGSLPKCKAPPSKSSANSGKQTIDFLDCINLSGNYVVNKCDIDLVVKAWTVGGGCLKNKAKTLRVNSKKRKNAGFKRACGSSNWNGYAVGCDKNSYKNNKCNWDVLRKAHNYPRGTLQKW